MTSTEYVTPMVSTALRSHRAGALTRANAGETVRLGGWIHRRRDLGGLVFMDLRDRAGLVQLSFDPRWTPPDVMARAAAATPESVALVQGTVAIRPEPARDRTMGSWEVEVQVTDFSVVGPAATPAIPVALKEGEEPAAEELRLRHRVLDLRRPELQANLMLRHRLLQRSRATLTELGFLEIETPILTKPTPEGARDYLVPSRVHPGEFYALPQSPQIYKQLLMVAGYDRYFQIARCFRDEDLRADRQPEFTQIDLEASFVSAEDVQAVVERVLADLWAEAGEAAAVPFPRIAWRDAMEWYGVDKPDLRYEYRIQDLTALIGADAAPFVQQAREQGGRVRGIIVPGGAVLSRKELDQLAAAAREAGAGGLIWARRMSGGWEGQGVKAIGPSALERLGGTEGELLVAVAGADTITSPALHAVRTALIRRPGAVPLQAHAFCWVVDFPLFERDPDTGAAVPAHHPFTAPHPEDVGRLDSDPFSVRALHYDAVYNGNELGSGSIRITDPAVQSAIFRRLGLAEPEIRRRFGFLLDGLAAGAPPHGGFALGFDRISMLLSGASSLRDVIAFPKTTAARALFEGAPSPVHDEDLRALHLQVCDEANGEHD
ncbi:MAG TPA: aspartate--tRNA ligase [Gemmatimonadales bacterium]|nr:aspartate--tRNA ligase [Gemmatimonadales bacterium]